MFNWKRIICFILGHKYDRIGLALGFPNCLRCESLIDKNYGSLNKYLPDNVPVERYPKPNRYVPVAGSQATRQDIGRFMSHGRQSKGYRKSVKAKIQPEEND